MHTADILLSSLSEDSKQGISESICEPPTQTRRAVPLAVSLLLAGLAEGAAKPEGASSIARAASDEDAASLNKLAEVMRGSQANLCMERGAGVIAEILGVDFLQCLGSVISRACGIGNGAARSLASLLMPPLLAALRQSLPPGPADGVAVADALEQQRPGIAKLLPAGLDAGSDARLSQCIRHVREAAPLDTAAMSDTATPVRTRSLWSRFMPVVLVGAVGAALVDHYLDDAEVRRIEVSGRVVPAVVDDHAILVAARLGPEVLAAAPQSSLSALLNMVEETRYELVQMRLGAGANAAVVESRLQQLRSGRLLCQAKPGEWQQASELLRSEAQQMQRLVTDMADGADDVRFQGALRAMGSEFAQW
jgi:hypothetical protein